MKHIWKAFTSILLTLCLLLGPILFCGPAFAAEPLSLSGCTDGSCGHNPIVVLPGINHSPTFLYQNGELAQDTSGNRIGGTLFILDHATLLADAMKTLLIPLLRMLIFQQDLGFTDAVYQFMSEMFAIQQTDTQGNTVEDLRVLECAGPINSMDDPEFNTDWFYRMIPAQKLAKEVGEDHIYLFTFPLFGDPMASADKLDAFIDLARKQTGHDKVDLLNVSLGGTIFTAYIDAYGWAKVADAVNVVAMLDGTDLVADMLRREFRLDNRFIYHQYFPLVLGELMDSAWLGYLANLLIRCLPRAVFADTLTRAMDAMLDTVVLHCPQFWAMVPAAQYPELAARYLADKPVLKAKTDRFYQAQCNLAENVLTGVQQGARVNSIAGANLGFGDVEYSFFSIVKSTLQINSDGILPLASTTMGATGAAPGKQLSQQYRDSLMDTAYLAPDNTVDTSTALLPDNTWIFLNQHHEVGNNDVVLSLAKELLCNPMLQDVHSLAEWPQYNNTCYTRTLRRTLLPRAQEVDRSICTPEQLDRLDAAITLGHAALDMTIANQSQIDTAQDMLYEILMELGQISPEEKASIWQSVADTGLRIGSFVVLLCYGGRGWTDCCRTFAPLGATFHLF